jgi:serine/threonine protein kinase
VSDFGMARIMEGQDSYYKSTSNHHPIKWCSVGIFLLENNNLITIETLKFGKYTQQSDVWAYGVLLWELFSGGAVPYLGMTNVETAEQVLAGYRMNKPELCPDSVYQIMTKCWAENPKERPTMNEIVEEIKGIIKNL